MENQNIQINEMETMLNNLRSIIVDGVQHGFFEFEISCEMIKERKRQIIIKAGKSYKHVIRENEILGS